MRALRRWNKEASILAGIVLVALLLRLWGINYGLPYIYYTDEAVFVNQAVAFGSGDLNPHDFRYPTLYSYLLFILYGVYFVVGYAMGWFRSVDDFAIQFFRDPTAFYLIGRGLTVILATATVPLVYFVGRKLYDKRVGLVGAFFMAFVYTHAQFSHYIKVQVPLAFFAILSFWLIWRVYEDGRRRDYILAGLFCGLSAAIWQLGVFLVVSLAMSHMLRALSTGDIGKRAALHGRLFGGLGCAALGFFLGSPFVILDFHAAWRDLVGVAAYATVPAAYDRGFLGYLSYARDGMGDILALLAIGGLLYAFYRHRSKDLLLVSYPMVTLLFLSLFRNQGDYYLNPTFPFLAIAASMISVEAASKLRVSATLQGPALATLAIAAAILPAIAIVRWDDRISQKDTRTLAKEWIEAMIPAGSKILLDSGKYYVSDQGPPLQDTVENLRRMAQASNTGGNTEGWTGGRPTRLAKESEFYRYLIAANKGITYDLVRITHDNASPSIDINPVPYYREQGVQYIVVSSSSYKEYSRSNTRFPDKVVAYLAFYDSLDKEAILLKEFPPLADRPGPGIKIYKLGS